MMNVSTSTSSASDVSSSQTQTKADTSSQVAEKSFEEEMKSVSQNDEKTEKNDTKTTEANKNNNKSEKDSKSEIDNNELDAVEELVSQGMLSGALNYTDFKYHNESQTILSQNIQNLLDTKNLISSINSATTIDYDVINMSDEDANFFANLVQNADMSMKDIVSQVVENSQAAKSVQVSSVLMEKLAESLRNNQPFRIDFDKNVSVIIKVNKDGSLMANFIPGDKAVEQYLKNNIASLRQRFDDENIKYSELSYSNSQDRKQQRRKKENDNE